MNLDNEHVDPCYMRLFYIYYLISKVKLKTKQKTTLLKYMNLIDFTVKYQILQARCEEVGMPHSDFSLRKSCQQPGPVLPSDTALRAEFCDILYLLRILFVCLSYVRSLHGPFQLCAAFPGPSLLHHPAGKKKHLCLPRAMVMADTNVTKDRPRRKKHKDRTCSKPVFTSRAAFMRK